AIGVVNGERAVEGGLATLVNDLASLVIARSDSLEHHSASTDGSRGGGPYGVRWPAVSADRRVRPVGQFDALTNPGCGLDRIAVHAARITVNAPRRGRAGCLGL